MFTLAGLEREREREGNDEEGEGKYVFLYKTFMTEKGHQNSIKIFWYLAVHENFGCSFSQVH